MYIKVVVERGRCHHVILIYCTSTRVYRSLSNLTVFQPTTTTPQHAHTMDGLIDLRPSPGAVSTEPCWIQASCSGRAPLPALNALASVHMYLMYVIAPKDSALQHLITDRRAEGSVPSAKYHVPSAASSRMECPTPLFFFVFFSSRTGPSPTGPSHLPVPASIPITRPTR